MRGEAPQIRRVDPLRAIAEAVVSLEAIQSARDAPVRLSGKSLERDGVDGTRQPVVWRVPARWPIGRHIDRARAERIAIMQMALKVEAGLERMDDADEPPWRAGRRADLFVARLVLQQLRAMPEIGRAHV